MLSSLWSAVIGLTVAVTFGSVGLAQVGQSTQDPVQGQTKDGQSQAQQDQQDSKEEVQMETATFGNGCFWCTEAVFLHLKGVVSVTSGYSGGQVPNPTYEQICTGMTGHAEVIHIKYKPDEISFDQLLEVFFATHDPTTLNRQGPDIGTQYRSVIFYHDEHQKERAELAKSELDKSKVYRKPIVTEITEFSIFFPAEDYHQNFFARNPNNQYCQIQAAPKIKKIKKVFSELIKDDAKR